MVQEPIALWDFFSGELGHEALYVQSLGGKFYDDHKDEMTVVALCWKGCAVLHQNTSDVQIELEDVAISTMDSEKHKGRGRYEWLIEQNHIEAIDAIKGIKARFGPAYWQNGKKNSLHGNVSTNQYLEPDGYKTDWHGATRFIADRLDRTGFRFKSGFPLMNSPYISLFDRNDPQKTFRNTKDWHFDFAASLARSNGLKLAVVKGLHPRPAPVDCVEFHAEHRDLRTFINIVTNAVIHLSPPSGTSELAMIAGCNLAALSYYKEHGDLGQQLLRDRGYRYWNYVTAPDDDVAAGVREFISLAVLAGGWQ